MSADVGQPIPPDTSHAVSVSLPTWKSNVGYEEGEEWVLSKMKTGYPRFFIHTSIARLADAMLADYGSEGEMTMLFPTVSVAARCAEFIRDQRPPPEPTAVRILHLVRRPRREDWSHDDQALTSNLCAVFFPSDSKTSAKCFWQHTGDGISSRRAEHCHAAYKRGELTVAPDSAGFERKSGRGPRRYQRPAPADRDDSHDAGAGGGAGGVEDEDEDKVTDGQREGAQGEECQQFVEERYGRNLAASLAESAKVAVKRRIADSMRQAARTEDFDSQVSDGASACEVSEDDVYLYPTGMSAICSAHRSLQARRSPSKSICFGFPYIDTLKVLEKWGPGCLFYGHGSSDDLDDLERRLDGGEGFLALFCEFPSNPLLKSPDLRRIRDLADRYDFAVVVDETVGNFLNVHVLPYADVVVSSLTKVFSGDSNVMGGSMVLNAKAGAYARLKQTLDREYEDNYWSEDAIFMERNSRDYASRIHRINANAEAIGQTLRSHARVKEVYYPKYSATRANYDRCRTPNGGYGGLLSATFFSTADAVTFFDRLETAKGPSLGTNFTLSSPYTLLAHYGELEWAARFGVEADLVRISVGLETTSELTAVFERALACLEGGSEQDSQP